MTIRVELQDQVYQENLDNLLRGSSSEVLGEFKGVPEGKFTSIEGPVTQFSSVPTSFRITTDSPGENHTIRATLISVNSANQLSVRNRIIEKQVVPKNETFVVALNLLKGENQIDVFTKNDSTFTSVTASHVGTFLSSYAREIFSSTQNPLDEQERAIFSKFSSRVTEILIPFQDLYADPKSLRALISRFITRAYMTKSGATEGVRDFGAALLGTTPIFVPTKTDRSLFEPDVIPLFRRQLEFAGFEAHAWIPNFEIIHWLCFIKLVDSSRHFYQIQEIGENEVLILANGEPEIHRFDFDDPEATAYREFNVTDFRVVIEVLTKLNITLCAAGYPFDLFVTAANPLGQSRLTFDSLVPFDSGGLLDSPPLDPGDDGWVGFTLSGRFENYALNSDPFELALDSLFIFPDESSSLPECVYDKGFFTQQISLLSQAVDIGEDVLVSGSLNEEEGTSEENISIDEFRVDTDVMDFSSLAPFTPIGAASAISLNSAVALAGDSSLQLEKIASGAFAQVDWSGAALNFTGIGGDIVYLSAWLGEDVFGDLVDGIPAYPGKLATIEVTLKDSTGDSATFIYHKEHLVEGPNVLPLLLDHPELQSGSLNRADVTDIEFRATSVDSEDLWESLYFGRMYVLASQAHFRPSRAKIELEDIDDVFPQSLFGSSLIFTDRFGGIESFTGDETYNNFAENAYVPNLFKVELEVGVGTENFDREATAENLRVELGRQYSNALKVSVVNDLPGEIYLDVFSKQFSSTGDRNTLSFSNPNPGPDLIDVTSFAGGLEGQVTRLLNDNIAIAQQFSVGGGPATLRFVELFLHRIGDPSGSLYAAIHEDDSGEPGKFIARSYSKFADSLASEIPDYEIFRFDSLSLTPGDYWIVLSGTPAYEASADSDNHVVWARQSGGGSLPSAITDGVFAGTFWTLQPGIHHYFKAIGEG